MNKKPHFFMQFICILTVLTAVLLQGLTHVVKMKPLAGYVPNEQPVKLSFKTYYDGSFQNYLTDHKEGIQYLFASALYVSVVSSQDGLYLCLGLSRRDEVDPCRTDVL